MTVDVEVLKVEIQKILDENRIPGASVALVDKDRTIWAGGVGRADVAAGVDVTAGGRSGLPPALAGQPLAARHPHVVQ